MWKYPKCIQKNTKINKELCINFEMDSQVIKALTCKERIVIKKKNKIIQYALAMQL